MNIYSSQHSHQSLLQTYYESCNHFCLLNSNNYQQQFGTRAFIGKKRSYVLENGNYNLGQLDAFIKKSTNDCYAFFSYDLKNGFENLCSKNKDFKTFPELIVVEPLEVIDFDDFPVGEEVQSIKAKEVRFSANTSKSEYLDNVEKIRNSIIEGDVYEVNYCIEFNAFDVDDIDVFQLYQKLNTLSPTPFSGLLKYNECNIISASPERFLKKTGKQLTSQPIKGTSKRYRDELQDNRSKQELSTSEKERAENLMIVDLVRNDLSRCSKVGTVKVDELFGIYSFEHVHQMISTISSEVNEDTSFSEILACTFPMGSMTGAPKISAMEMIDEIETTKRGPFSGSIGYITPNGDFDLNVLIRSLYYNSKDKTLSFEVGSAITFDSQPEKEYEECMLKAEAIINCFKN